MNFLAFSLIFLVNSVLFDNYSISFVYLFLVIDIWKLMIWKLTIIYIFNLKWNTPIGSLNYSRSVNNSESVFRSKPLLLISRQDLYLKKFICVIEVYVRNFEFKMKLLKVNLGWNLNIPHIFSYKKIKRKRINGMSEIKRFITFFWCMGVCDISLTSANFSCWTNLGGDWLGYHVTEALLGWMLCWWPFYWLL